MWTNAEKAAEQRGRSKIFRWRIALQIVSYVVRCIAAANLGHALRCVADADDVPTSIPAKSEFLT